MSAPPDSFSGSPCGLWFDSRGVDCERHILSCTACAEFDSLRPGLREWRIDLCVERIEAYGIRVARAGDLGLSEVLQ